MSDLYEMVAPVGKQKWPREDEMLIHAIMRKIEPCEHALDDEPLYRLVEDRVKCNEDCQSPHPQQRYVRVWSKETDDDA